MDQYRRFILRNTAACQALWDTLKPWAEQAKANQPLEVRVGLYEDPRNLQQNAYLWALLTDISEQVEWYGQRLTPEDWKDLLSASWKKQRVVPAIDGGGFVALGVRTSKLSKKQMAELLELILAFGAERGVRFGNDGGLDGVRSA